MSDDDEHPEVWKQKYNPIPILRPNFEEIALQMQINADIIKDEITKHVDKELERIRNELQKTDER